MPARKLLDDDLARLDAKIFDPSANEAVLNVVIVATASAERVALQTCNLARLSRHRRT